MINSWLIHGATDTNERKGKIMSVKISKTVNGISVWDNTTGFDAYGKVKVTRDIDQYHMRNGMIAANRVSKIYTPRPHAYARLRTDPKVREAWSEQVLNSY